MVDSSFAKLVTPATVGLVTCAKALAATSIAATIAALTCCFRIFFSVSYTTYTNE